MKQKTTSSLLAAVLAALVFSPVYGPSDADKDQAAIMADIEKPRGSKAYTTLVLSIPALRSRLEKQMDRQRFDDALKALADKDAITLHQCDPACMNLSSEWE